MRQGIDLQKGYIQTGCSAHNPMQRTSNQE